MAVVVRCTGCSGLARVGPEAVGLLVVCPRCGDPFMADPVPEEAAFAAPAPPPPPPPPRPARAEPVAPPRPRRKRPPADRTEELHDHPPVDAGGVPFSVIVGLALLPLTIPMLWLIGPVLVGNPPHLTLATPVSLAAAAAVLCLAVAYTVDWTPVTRIKGVLTLVGLAYFAGLSLYFLKKEAAEGAQQWLAADGWHEFRPPGKEYEVRLPGKETKVDGPSWPVSALKLSCYRAAAKGFGRTHFYVVGSGADHNPEAGDDKWFDDVEQSLQKTVGGQLTPGESVAHLARLPHRQWRVELPRGSDALIVRVYRAKDRVYLLAAQGPDLEPGDEEAERFFGSFAVLDGRK